MEGWPLSPVHYTVSTRLLAVTYYFTTGFKGWSVKNSHFLTGQAAEICRSGFKPFFEIQWQVLGFLGSYHAPATLRFLVGAYCSVHFAQCKENIEAQQKKHTGGTAKLFHLKEHFGWSAMKTAEGRWPPCCYQ